MQNRKFLKRFLDALFPFQCCGCKRLGSPLCFECARRPLVRNDERPLGIFAPFSYSDPRVQTLIHRFKYQGEWALATFLAEQMIGEFHFKRIPLVKKGYRSFLVPVPLHPERFHERGYNQSEKLADALSKKLHIPVVSFLQRVRAGAQQTHLSKTQRQENIQGAFQLRRRVESRAHILLVDDVMTTGSTLAAAASAFPPKTSLTSLAFAHQPLGESALPDGRSLWI